MKRRAFGNTGLQVSELGLGCARIGGIFKSEPAQFIELLTAARDRGINFFDTADMYSQGESEKLLGKAFKRGRHDVIIASKVGYCLPSQRQLIAKIKPFVRPLIKLLKIKRENLPQAVRGELAQNFEPAYIRSAVEASLKRLRTDYLDILQLHSAPVEVVERGDWQGALEALKRAGKIRHYGISCDTLESAQAALKVADVSCLQVQVSLLEQRFAEAVVPRAHQQRMGIIARECLANGLLVKAEHEIDVAAYSHSPEQAEQRKQQLAAFRAAAARENMPLARYALRYATQLEGVSVALIGVSRMDQLTSTLQQYGA